MSPSYRAGKTALPSPVALFAEIAGRSERAPIRTLVIETTAWMRRPRLPRIPLEIRMAHRLGEAFVHDIRIGRGRWSFGFGMDAYVDGHGLMRVGQSVQSGARFDQGALIAMWGEALVVPSAWLDRADVRWEAIGPTSARLIVPGPERAIPITVTFDTVTGLPAACAAARYRGDGPLAPWSGLWSDWRAAEDGMFVPRRLRVHWLDEAEPWLDITVESITVDAPIEDALARARGVLRDVSEHGLEGTERGPA
jgi:uncharacterized protein DUF6544